MALTSFSSMISSATIGGSTFGYLADRELAAEIDLGRLFTIEPGARVGRVFLGTTTINLDPLFLRAGVRLGG